MMALLLALLISVVVADDLVTVHVGWLKTVDEYYLGANNSIQDAGVQYILDSVIPELEKDPSKRFIYVEIAFFQRWWREQDAAMQDRVKRLVKSGQLEFINGGWCMNDESAPSDEAIVTQMTLGHQFLMETFGVTPTVGWQIDPFGHSNTMMSLFSQMGFSSVFFARSDYQDYDIRKNQSRLEYVWRPSKSLGTASDIFTHTMWGSTYCNPEYFFFESGADPINDDDRLENVNVEQRAQQFVDEMNERRQHYRPGSSDVFVPFGCDFQYQNANINFKNLDKLFRFINARPEKYGMKLIYSTPSMYIDAVHKLDLSWDLKTDDIFPYADRPYAYWTGYMTSRPALKGYVRSRNALLRFADKFIASFAAVSGPVQPLVDSVNVLRRAFSVAQHHDAVAGTEKQHVADDYAKLLANGTTAVHKALSPLIAKTTKLSGGSSFEFCELLNVTECSPLTTQLSAGASVPIVLFNSLGWGRVEPVTIPGSVEIVGMPYQVTTDPFTGKTRTTFLACVPAFGWSSYTARPSTVKPLQPTSDRSISNLNYTLVFDDNGLVSINNLPVSSDFLWYNASTGNNKNSTQASGAYIFRPNSTVPFPTRASGPLSVEIVKGELFESAFITYNDWVKSEIRVYLGGMSNIEFRSMIGPIDISDGHGKEVIHRFQTGIASQNIWFTDSSWEEMQRRELNYRESWSLNVTNPVAGNYVPMNQAAYFNDSAHQFTILSDRSRGCASLQEGQFESMLHRRLLVDDQRGVDEPLNETEAIVTSEHVMLSAPGASFRQDALRVNHPLQVAFGVGFSGVVANNSQAGLLKPLPSNVHIMDYYMLTDKMAIFRVRHLYGKDEPLPWSAPVTLNLDEYLPRQFSAEETQLTTVQPPSFVQDRLKWKVAGESSTNNDYDDQDESGYKSPSRRALSITLNPMQIRTYILTFA